jgi:hypothetical protein
MSDALLRYVPNDPTYVPSSDAASRAEALLASLLPNAETVEHEIHPTVVFVDSGANWSGVSCPACDADAEPWWGDAMSSAHESGFADLATVAPCCGNSVSLDKLNYVWPVGFARFVLQALNPNCAGLASDQLQRLGSVVGCPLREIPTHL